MRDWITLLIDEERDIVPANFNDLIEDIINQARVVYVRNNLEDIVTQLATLPIKDQPIHIKVMVDSMAKIE